ncbi:MAG: hypothetical protein ACW975_01995 [Candidatus Thorarchaeota archaeon]|jgi:hypothetical protein
MTQNLKSMTIRDLTTLWWSKGWIRALVILLFPIGAIDVVYTLLAIDIYGVAVEFNPITRFFVGNGLWLPWSILNIMGFALFCMLAGSYYLHTRTRLEGPDTLWLSSIIALRVCLAAYNITYFYIPFVLTIYPPLWIGLFTFILVFMTLDRLLTRRDDLTWRGIRDFFAVRRSNIEDARLIRSAGVPPESKEPVPKLKTTIQKSVWAKRSVYLLLSMLMVVAMGWVIEFLAIAMGIVTWSEQHGWFFYFDVTAGRFFVVSLLGIIFVLSLSMFFIMKAFSVEEEMPTAW